MDLRNKLEKHPLVEKIQKQRNAGYKVYLTDKFFILPGSYPGTVTTSTKGTAFYCMHLEQLENFLDNFTTTDEHVYQEALGACAKAERQAQEAKDKQKRGTQHYMLNDEAAEAFPLIRKHILRGDSPFHRDAVIPAIVKNNRYDTITETNMDVTAWQDSALKALDKKIIELANLRKDVVNMDVQATEEFLKSVQDYCRHFIENGESNI